MAAARRQTEGNGCSSLLAVVVVSNVIRLVSESGNAGGEYAIPVILAAVGIGVIFFALRALYQTVRRTARPRTGAGWRGQPPSDPRSSPLYDRELDAWPGRS